MTVTSPGAMAVARPFSSTVSFASSAEEKVYPPAVPEGRVAVSCAVSPTPSTVRVVLMETPVGAFLTVTLRVAFRPL